MKSPELKKTDYLQDSGNVLIVHRRSELGADQKTLWRMIGIYD